MGVEAVFSYSSPALCLVCQKAKQLQRQTEWQPLKPFPAVYSQPYTLPSSAPLPFAALALGLGPYLSPLYVQPVPPSQV